MSDPSAPDGRTRHYGVFYGLGGLDSEEPVALVHGNCQAESLRQALDGGGLATVRMPPVHELEATDLPHLEAWLARASVLVSQPVRAGYRGLPVGAAQLASCLPEAAGVVRVPVIRFAGLYPAQAIVRSPTDPGLDPPVVAYHDLRVLAEAAARRTGAAVRRATLTPATVRTIAGQSVAELQRREAAHDTVIASDLFAAPSFAQMRTINHPGNEVFVALAARVRARLGLPEHVSALPGPLLDRVHAPREEVVIAAFGLDAEPVEDWRVDAAPVTVAAVRDAQLAFYARHPEVVDAGLTRHAATLALLGLP